MQGGSQTVCIRVSAPGKVILFGEHSVVYNKTAIAATLNLRTHLELTETSSAVVRLKLPSIAVDTSFELSALANLRTREFQASEETYQKALSVALDDLCSEQTPELLANQRLALLVFLHCYLSLECPSSGLDITIGSDLVIGAGQGSSASYSLVLATALFLFQSAKTSTQAEYLHRDTAGGAWCLTPSFTELILERAMSCERLIHGTPSGLDHTVELLGGAVRFVRDAPPTALPWAGSGLRVLMVDTKVPRNTKDLVQRVRHLHDRRPQLTQALLHTMDLIAVDAAHLLRTSPPDFDIQFADLVTLNMGLLRVLGVSHPSLDDIVSIAARHGLSGKLTGAGGGGFAYVFLPQNISSSNITSLNQELTAAGYGATDVTLAGTGLQIHEFTF